jgi:hypothetical protein
MSRGKHKYIETPEKLWELFMSYRDKIKNNPIQIVEQKRGNTIIPKDADLSRETLKELFASIVHLPVQRPLTLEGFYNYLEDNDIITDATDYFENKDSRYCDYIRICSRIKRTIRQDQIEGGMAGIYNPSITQRLNGLVEKHDVTTDGESINAIIVDGRSKNV